MTKHRNAKLEALQAGQSYTWTEPEGGDLASMRAAIKHGQTLTMSPVTDPGEIRVGDIVFLRWHQGYITHLVSEIQGNQFLIVNSLGKVNGWVSGSDILGRVTQIIEPEPRPELPEMLEQLETAYRGWIEREQPAEDEARRLLSIVDDLRWYAGRIGAQRCYQQPRANKWSFEQNLWYFTKQARDDSAASAASPVHYLIDRGKTCVGLAAEIFALFEYGTPY
jgi:hypothetical protein